LFKIFFALIGYYLTHSIFGAFVGLMVGWYADMSTRSKTDKKQQTQRNARTAEDIRNYYQTRSTYTIDFPTILMALSAAVMKADGKVLKVELNYIKTFFKRQFGNQFTPEHLQKLKQYLDTEIPLPQICSDIRLQLRPESRLQLIGYLFKIAQADKHISTSELNVIANIASLIGIAQIDFERLKQQFIIQNDNIDENYRTLGLTKNASLQEIKTAYRTLSKKFHPDTITDKNEQAQKQAKEQFQKIQAAYQAIIQQYK